MSDDFEDLPGSAFAGLPKPGPRAPKAPTTTARAMPSEVVFELIQRALNTRAGIAVSFETEGAAINWHQRFNMMRATLIRRADTPQEFRHIAVRRDKHRVLFEPVDAFIKRLNIEEI